MKNSERRGPMNSKLNPFTPRIDELLKFKASYVGIQKTLKKEFGVYAAVSTIYSFVKVRTKPKKVYDHMRIHPSHLSDKKEKVTIKKQNKFEKKSDESAEVGHVITSIEELCADIDTETKMEQQLLF